MKLAVDDLPLSVHIVDLLPQSVDVPLVLREEKRDAESDPRAAHDAIVVRILRSIVVLRPEVPAVNSAPPLAVPLAADRSIETDVAGKIASILLRALDPGIDVLKDPIAILRLSREEVGRQGKVRRQHVLRMIASQTHHVAQTRPALGAW